MNSSQPIDADHIVAWLREQPRRPAVFAFTEGSPERDLACAIERQLTQQEVLVDALDFYADPDNYFALMVVPDRPCGDFVYDVGPLTDDDKQYYTDYRFGGVYYGKRARQALAAVRDSEPI